MMHFHEQPEIAHRTRGRVRLRVHERRGDTAFFGEAARRLSEIEGIKTVRGNCRSASIVIAHDDDFTLTCVHEIVVAAGAAVPMSAESAARSINRARRRRGGARVDRGAEIFVALLQVVVAIATGSPLITIGELVAENVLRAAVRSSGSQLAA